jgi:hypothetical protein
VGDGTWQLLANILNITDSAFELISDGEYFESITQLWIGIYDEITKLRGHSP